MKTTKKSVTDRLSALLRKIKSSYTIGVHKHPLVFTIAGVLFINLIVLLASAFIADAIDDTFNGVVDAFARGSIKWLITPNSVLNVDNPKTMFLASVVVVLSMVLFSGVVIAMTTNALKGYFEKKSNAEGNLFLQDHIIIFNWNSKVPQIVEDLVYTEESSTVLIYSSKEKEYIKSQITNVMRKSKAQNLAKVNVIIKSGNPILKGGLLDISIENAKSIIIMSRDDIADSIGDEISNTDLFTLKTLISVGGMNVSPDCAIIVEVSEAETSEVIKNMSKTVKSLADNHIIPIAFNRRLGLFICQFILNPGLEKVFNELLSFEGAEIYPIAKMSIKEALNSLDKAIPVMLGNDVLYVLAENKDNANSSSSFTIPKKDIHLKKVDNLKDFNVILIGDNSKKRYIMETLATYKDNIYPNIKILDFESINEDFLTFIGKTNKKCVIMILSDESAGIQSYDSNVYHAVIKLQKILAAKPNLHVIVELLDPTNHNIIGDFNVENTIVSNKLIGLLIAQLAINKENYLFYENLLSLKPDDKEDFEIRIDFVYDLLNKDELSFASRVEFVSSFYYSSDCKLIPIGIIQDGAIAYLPAFPLQEPINLALSDKIIYIQY